MIDLSKYTKPEQDEFSDRLVNLTSGPYLDYIENCESVLDVGCGTGRLVRHLVEKGHYNVAGITFDKKEIEFGVNKLGLKKNVHIFEGDMHQLPFPEKTFDAVVSWDNLEHSPAPYIALCEMYRVLKPEGRALIYIPGTDWIDCNYHFIVLNIRQMKHLAEMIGFEVVDVINRGDQDGVYKLRKI